MAFDPALPLLSETFRPRSREAGLGAALAARLQARAHVSVLQLGPDVGGLREWVTPHLPVDYSWVHAANLADLSRQRTDLVLASAWIARHSANGIADLARTVSDTGAVFFASQIYTGVRRWAPRHPSDNATTAALHAAMTGDRGQGPALGPTTIAHLADRFRLCGYIVTEGDASLTLGAGDTADIAELAREAAEIAVALKAIEPQAAAAWVARPKTGFHAAHVDLLAVPGVT